MVTTSEAVEQFLASLRARHAPTNTVKAYTHDLRHFLAVVPVPLVEVTAPLIQAFLQGDGHHGVATRGRRYSTLCAFYHWAMRQELVEVNPMERLDPIPNPKRNLVRSRLLRWRRYLRPFPLPGYGTGLCLCCCMKRECAWGKLSLYSIVT